MHELGLARAIAAELRSRGQADETVSIRVSGGRAEAVSFEQSLLAHLFAEAPELSERRIQVVFIESGRTCSVCALEFEGTSISACPACGGPPLPSFEHEQIELELGPEVDATCA